MAKLEDRPRETAFTADWSAVEPAEVLSDPKTVVSKLESLLQGLENQATRLVARQCLHKLEQSLDQARIKTLSLQVVDIPDSEPIRLLLHPAVFSPEDWGRTFAEGLLKTPEMFDGKEVVELGTGSGWISLLLLRRTRVQSLLGLDINPVAVLIARLNTWLNGSSPDGTLLESQGGIAIVKAFQVQVSDLLAAPLKKNRQFDHVIGCIPQVLHPDRLASIGKRFSTRDLYDLSNYCFEQGILEDRFGLPLIASALEQSQLCLKPRGQVTLIIGGRPGHAAIEAMFRRRGLIPTLKWSRRIQQADDTDLASLVALEDTHGIQFDFFMSINSEMPVSASTAVRLLGKEQRVYHDLLVYQAETYFEKATFAFLNNLHKMGLDSLRRELDFSRITEEQVSFLERLSRDLLKSKTLPYPHERGDLSLRKRLARFLAIYCHQSIDAGQLFVGPERAQLLELVLRMVTKTGQKVLLSQSLASVYGPVLERAGLDVVLGNDDLSELLKLDDLLSPAICLISPRQFKHPSPILLDVLSAHAMAHHDRWYLIDDSAWFDIGSGLGANALLRLTAQEELPSNMVLLYGLIKNVVSPDLELSFFVNAPQEWLEGLDVGAELTYSRIGYLTQTYYEWLFDDLLAFPFSQGMSSKKYEPHTSRQAVDDFKSITRDPVFAPKPVDVNDPNLIRLDYGEFESPVPDLLVKGIIKGFLESPVEGLPDLVSTRVAFYTRSTRGVEIDPRRVVLGQGVFPLFGNLIQTLGQRLRRKPIIALPGGSYGLCYPLVPYHSGIVQEVATTAENGFLISAEQILKLEPKPDLIWLTQPNNPSGLFFEPNAVAELMRACARREIYVLADEIFFLLSNRELGAMTPASLSFGQFLDRPESKWLFLSDGFSKAFAAGGLRCGFMICPDETWSGNMRSTTWLPPKSTLRAWDALYSAFLDESPYFWMDLGQEKNDLRHYLDRSRASLDDHRHRLLKLLKQYGLDDGISTPYRGALFVLAKLADQTQKLATESGLLINPAEWARTPGWSRICYSLTSDRFEAALLRLEEFLTRHYS